MKKKIVLVLIYTLIQFGLGLFIYWLLYDKINWKIIKGFSIYIVFMSFIGFYLMEAHIQHFSNK